jgi:hypothetical protein
MDKANIKCPLLAAPHSLLACYVRRMLVYGVRGVAEALAVIGDAGLRAVRSVLED